MIQVYSAANAADAHLVCEYLRDHGIEAVIQGEELAGAWGDVPLTSKTVPGVWVSDEDTERARALLENR